jgi:hypothetical protein
MIEKLKGKLEKAFSDNITEGEKIRIKLQPTSGEALVVTDKKVMIIKAGVLAGAGFFGAKCTTFNFTEITSVDLRLGLMGGHIQITVAGSTDIKGRNMVESGNACTFNVDYRERMKEVASIIRESVEQVKKGNVPPVEIVQEIAVQIKNLHDLKIQGIISEADFEAGKRKLLGQ